MLIPTVHRFRKSLALAALVMLGLSDPALANQAQVTAAPPVASTQQATPEPFTAARFEALQADNALILVDVAATWCPTCKAQKAVIDAFRQQHPEIGLHVLTVDFDTQKEWVKHFKAPRQSTLLVYKGSEQRWFAVAETREDTITTALLEAAGS
jgi:thiol-disulfide isomerase/thioredoxin